ncbi:unnamed protein product, partial [Ceratitis capitata]
MVNNESEQLILVGLVNNLVNEGFGKSPRILTEMAKNLNFLYYFNACGKYIGNFCKYQIDSKLNKLPNESNLFLH